MWQLILKEIACFARFAQWNFEIQGLGSSSVDVSFKPVYIPVHAA